MEKNFTDSLKNLCSLFLHHMLYTKKVSQHTLRAYENDLKSFFDEKKTWKALLLDSDSNLPKVKIKQKKDLELFIKEAINKKNRKWNKLAATSKGRKLATIRSFIKWLADYNYINNDFRHLFKSPKTPVKIPNFLSVDEILFVVNLLNKEKENNRKNIDRDIVLFFLLYGGGLRVSEACHLETKNIKWNDKVLKIKGKGNKERLVAIPDQSLNQLKLLKDNSPYIFGDAPLPERKAYDIIKNIGIRAGFLKPLHPHALRHSFATHLLSGGSDLRVLQELLGHKTLTATQKYTHLNLIQLSQTLEKFHPIYKKQSS